MSSRSSQPTKRKSTRWRSKKRVSGPTRSSESSSADETFTYTEWEGQGGWMKVSLERKIFQTNASDIELFRRIDKLLKESPDSVVARDLARVYLLVLAAGFQG